jgi:hypothetical protein
VSGLRLGWAFSTRLSAHAYGQFNSLDRRFVGNLRLRFNYRPGSDLYLVLNEERGTAEPPTTAVTPGVPATRGVALKLSYLWQF